MHCYNNILFIFIAYGNRSEKGEQGLHVSLYDHCLVSCVTDLFYAKKTPRQSKMQLIQI